MEGARVIVHGEEKAVAQLYNDGDYQVKLNHGVSKVHSGKRHTLGVIFHDAV